MNNQDGKLHDICFDVEMDSKNLVMWFDRGYQKDISKIPGVSKVMISEREPTKYYISVDGRYSTEKVIENIRRELKL